MEISLINGAKKIDAAGMALTSHVFAHTSGEESLARFVEPDACALLDQHADFTQFVFVQTHLAALAFAIIFSSLHRVVHHKRLQTSEGRPLALGAGRLPLLPGWLAWTQRGIARALR